MAKTKRKDTLPRAPGLTALRGNAMQGGDAPEARREEARIAALGEAFAAADRPERERLERIMDLLPCYVTLIDENHRILYHNAAFEEYFGKPNARPCYAVMRGLETPCFFCPPLKILKGRKRPGVSEWVHPDNRRVFRVHSYPFTDSNGADCVLGVGFNITDSMRVQQALDLSEQSYRAITDNLTIGIALLDPELRIKAGNTRLSQWFVEAFRLDSRICALLRCGADWAAAQQGGKLCPDCPFKASFKDGQGHEKEFSALLPEGRERSLRMVTCPVLSGKGQNGRVRAMILMLEDITNRLHVNQQLQRARKLEAMNTLAGGIAHEINQPLSALHLYASGLQMLLEKSGDLPQETTQERLGLIMREADKIRSIISNMRSLVTREGRVELLPVSLAKAVRHAYEVMRRQFAGRGIAFTAEIPDFLPLVLANAIQLEQVLINLFSNSMHAMESEAARDNGRSPRIRVRAYIVPESGRVRLEVADSGPGLPSSAERIFDPFFTTKEGHEGMGLGLSIVHGLISLWGGEISAIARHPDLGGAVFYADMHMAAENPEAAPLPGTLGPAEHSSPAADEDRGGVS